MGISVVDPTRRDLQNALDALESSLDEAGRNLH